jgi:PGF-CTERM protein
MDRRGRSLLVVALAVLAIGALVPATAAATTPATAATSTATPTPPATPPTNHSTNTSLGCVDGICHDDPINVTQVDGLDAAERDRLLARSMARVEYLRGESFTESVPVRVVDSETFGREQLTPNGSDPRYTRWNDQVWKALFIVGDNTSTQTAISETLTGSVNGLYSPRRDEIVIVADDPDAPRISEATLIHELTHALQDQRHDLTSPRFSGDTQDADLAVTGLYEGEAGYIEALYRQRCDDDSWRCQRASPTSGEGGATNRGILTVVLQPYSDGPGYVHEIVTTEGWAGVDERMADPPTTTSEIIHREPIDPQPVDPPSTATAGWHRYTEPGRNGTEVAGEASIFAMFWYQATTARADTVDPGTLYESEGEYDSRTYSAPPSDGWAGDALVPYRRGDDDGYVWTTEWGTPGDAAEFHRAYTAILTARNATETDPGIYELDDAFAGAYGIERDGTRVRIVHAPTTDGLRELDPGLEPSATSDQIPGFGIAGALLALLAAGWALAWPATRQRE